MNISEVRRIRPSIRDVLILRVKDVDAHDEEQLTTLAQELHGATRIPIIVLPETLGLESVDESAMLAAGWVRKPQLIVAPTPDAKAQES